MTPLTRAVDEIEQRITLVCQKRLFFFLFHASQQAPIYKKNNGVDKLGCWKEFWEVQSELSLGKRLSLWLKLFVKVKETWTNIFSSCHVSVTFNNVARAEAAFILRIIGVAVLSIYRMYSGVQLHSLPFLKNNLKKM